MHILISDGSALKNPGPGGAAYAIANNDRILKIQAYHNPHTTNNIMELYALIVGLKENNDIKTVYTDSSYVVNGINQWIHTWKKNGWMTAAKKPVKNQDLWQELDQLITKSKPQIYWIKGHMTITDNMSDYDKFIIRIQHNVDQYARESAEQQRNISII